MPFVYSILFPILLTDLVVEIYHRVCFKLCDIPYVERWRYITIDRHKLKKLNIIQKINCVYCGYVNGYILYIQEIAARTELYWCGIKHDTSNEKIYPKHHENFEEREKYL